MSFSKSTTSLSLLTFVLFLQKGLSVPDHDCLNSMNFNSTYDDYGKSLNELMNYLSYETPPTGFCLGSRGHGLDRAYGLAICAGDANPSDCANCLSNDTNEIRTLCPDSKRAVIWHGLCTLKYSDEDFFGQVNSQLRYLLTDSQNASDPVSFGQKTNDLISKLVEIAYVIPRTYVTNTVRLGASETLELTAQCSTDLSGTDCKRCLTNSAVELQNCCAGKKGATVYSASCAVAYSVAIVV
ncbi:cysteine-rich repeat secretory protein 38-like [Corylus avellana]|uniref:cysteine-rich repeat secretory protein 38-like n=1 Tax=Corylus avellana TaxID=13451 RepID=UPI00286A0651|nr:cysteine-rich repeat secretory protein 38-like [Corylus avellana]